MMCSYNSQICSFACLNIKIAQKTRWKKVNIKVWHWRKAIFSKITFVHSLKEKEALSLFLSLWFVQKENCYLRNNLYLSLPKIRLKVKCEARGQILYLFFSYFLSCSSFFHLDIHPLSVHIYRLMLIFIKTGAYF